MITLSTQNENKSMDTDDYNDEKEKATKGDKDTTTSIYNKLVPIRESIVIPFKSTNLQYKVVQFLSSYIPTCGAMILKMREGDTRITPSH